MSNIINAPLRNITKIEETVKTTETSFNTSRRDYFNIKLTNPNTGESFTYKIWENKNYILNYLENIYKSMQGTIDTDPDLRLLMLNKDTEHSKLFLSGKLIQDSIVEIFE